MCWVFSQRCIFPHTVNCPLSLTGAIGCPVKRSGVMSCSVWHSLGPVIKHIFPYCAQMSFASRLQRQGGGVELRLSTWQPVSDRRRDQKTRLCNQAFREAARVIWDRLAPSWMEAVLLLFNSTPAGPGPVCRGDSLPPYRRAEKT